MKGNLNKISKACNLFLTLLLTLAFAFPQTSDLAIGTIGDNLDNAPPVQASNNPKGPVGATGPTGPTGPGWYTYDDDQYNQVEDIQSRNEDLINGLLARDGYYGFGIGWGDDETVPNNFNFVVFVDQTADQSPIPPDIEGVPVKPVVSEPFEAHDHCGVGHRIQRPLPVPMGISTSSNQYCGAGTLGFKACDGGGAGYITNNHVAAAGGPFSCPNGAPFGTPQFHRATGDAGCALAANIGNLIRFVPLGGGFNRVDAAYVRSDNQRVSSFILDIGAPVGPARWPRLGEYVRKSGRTTGFTWGRAVALNATVVVGYGNCGAARFIGQILVSPISWCGFSQPGDSGSPVVGFNNNPVGLLFAGSRFQTIVNPLPVVLAQLGVALCP